MKAIDVSKRTIGVNFNEQNEAEIIVWSPTAEQVAIVVDEEKMELNREELGYWCIKTEKIKPGTRYKFLLNNKDQYPDPASLSQPGGVHDKSEAFDLKKFHWSNEQKWHNIPLEDYIIYELHTGTFTPEGTFAAIEKKIDHLISLGVTAIEIMPVAQFPGNRNWGYDGVFPFAVQNSYGGAKDLQHLVNACHEKGLAVILDVVYNHLGPEGNYLGVFGPYFTDKYKTPWGNAINFDDAWCDGVRRYFIENALMWFRDFHIDALRLDAVHAIKDFGPVHILQEIKKYVDELMKATGRKHYLIVELDLNDNRFINPLKKGGYGMDAQWVDEFHHALRVTATGEQIGYYSDFTGIENLAKAYKDAYVYDGQFSPHRKKTFGIKTENEGKQFIVFSQNHDQVGNRMLGERTSGLVSFEMQKLLAAAVVISPYLPMLFMGEEWSEPNPFLYFVSHTDKDLADAVRKGRKEEFAAFHIQGEAPDPVAENTFLQSKLQWNLPKEGRHKIMLDYYKELIQLRKTNPVLKELNRENLEVITYKEQNSLLVKRWSEKEKLVCFLNFSKEPQSIRYNQQLCNKIFDSADIKWNGFSSAPNQIQDEFIIIQPESIVIYQTHY
jgi:maltooligosyltrehalose trehalohydrolase